MADIMTKSTIKSTITKRQQAATQGRTRILSVELSLYNYYIFDMLNFIQKNNWFAFLAPTLTRS